MCMPYNTYVLTFVNIICLTKMHACSGYHVYYVNYMNVISVVLIVYQCHMII